MDYTALNRLIDQLTDYLPAKPLLFSAHKRSDWKRFWDLVKEVQAGFRSGVHYPSNEQQQAAWVRFGSLCTEAKARTEYEHQVLTSQSKEHRDLIIFMCFGIEFKPIHDIVFFFDKTNADEVKEWGRLLGKAMREFSERKHGMIRQHKDECHQRIQKVKESHDLFWNQRKQVLASRQQEWEAKQRQYVSKKEGARRGIEGNLDNNRTKRQKLIEVREKVAYHARETRAKIDDSESAKWSAIWTGWLVDDMRRIEELDEKIAMVSRWIEEDEVKLRNFDR